MCSRYRSFEAVDGGSTDVCDQRQSLRSATVKGHDINDRIVYNTVTGALYYDADGSGATAAIQFATLKERPTVTAADFIEGA